MDQENSLYLRYVDLSRKEGLTSAQVRKSLINEGWTKSQIDQLITTKQERIVVPPRSHNDSLLNLRLKNGKLFLKVLVVLLVGVGTAYIWQAQTSKATNYQSVFSNFMKAVELKNRNQALNLESQSEKQLLGNSATYNSCNATTSICSQALSANSLKNAKISTLNYTAAGGVMGKEQVISEKAAGCSSDVINVDITAIPYGNSWRINSINIVDPSNGSCHVKATPPVSTPASVPAANGASQAAPRETPSKAANNRQGNPQSNSNGKSQAYVNTGGIVPVSLSVGRNANSPI